MRREGQWCPIAGSFEQPFAAPATVRFAPRPPWDGAPKLRRYAPRPPGRNGTLIQCHRVCALRSSVFSSTALQSCQRMLVSQSCWHRGADDGDVRTTRFDPAPRQSERVRGCEPPGSASGVLCSRNVNTTAKREETMETKFMAAAAAWWAQGSCLWKKHVSSRREIRIGCSGRRRRPLRSRCRRCWSRVPPLRTVAPIPSKRMSVEGATRRQGFTRRFRLPRCMVGQYTTPPPRDMRVESTFGAKTENDCDDYGEVRAHIDMFEHRRYAFSLDRLEQVQRISRLQQHQRHLLLHERIRPLLQATGGKEQRKNQGLDRHRDHHGHE